MAKYPEKRKSRKTGLGLVRMFTREMFFVDWFSVKRGEKVGMERRVRVDGGMELELD